MNWIADVSCHVEEKGLKRGIEFQTERQVLKREMLNGKPVSMEDEQSTLMLIEMEH